MEFSEFASGLLPFCIGQMKKEQYFNEIVGNFIQDAAMDSCPVLHKKADTKYRFLKGTRKIQPADASYLYANRDKKKFSHWIANRTEECDSYEAVAGWLHDNGIKNPCVDDACADLLEKIILSLMDGSTATSEISNDSCGLTCDISLIEDIEEKIKLLPRPNSMPVPKEATENEKTYINELYKAYGDAEGLLSFSKKDLGDYPDYADDLADRRVDYYSAASIQRGVLELGTNKLSNQFDVLKQEIFDGVKDTARKSHPNGYERMLSVMEQAVKISAPNYLLSSSPFWISGKIKKGVCHHLVNDHKLRWVKKKNG